jgi:hypothetical protein
LALFRLGLSQLALPRLMMLPVPMQQVLPVPVMRLAAMMGWSLAISASIRPGLAYALYAPAE